MLNLPAFPALTIMKLFILVSVNFGLTKQREVFQIRRTVYIFSVVFLLLVQAFYLSNSYVKLMFNRIDKEI